MYAHGHLQSRSGSYPCYSRDSPNEYSCKYAKSTGRNFIRSGCTFVVYCGCSDDCRPYGRICPLHTSMDNDMASYSMTLLLTLLVNPQLVRQCVPLYRIMRSWLLMTRTVCILCNVQSNATNFGPVKKRKQKISHLEWHEVTVTGARQTALIEALQKTISGIPATQRSAAILLTDGQIHDIPTTPDAMCSHSPAHRAPVHTVLFGSKRNRSPYCHDSDAGFWPGWA